MIIPKTFSDGKDFESLLLTSILGTFIALREDLISFRQAESYWLSDFTAELFEEISLSEEIISIIQEGIKLKELDSPSEEYFRKIDELITQSKELISRYYTEYDETAYTVIN
ncbi:MAG: DUF3969 family protein [Erysipelotrichaceae bacterium]|nr:DUF3969 family protein [Erysipelotrichaceae bacterium]